MTRVPSPLRLLAVALCLMVASCGGARRTIAPPSPLFEPAALQARLLEEHGLRSQVEDALQHTLRRDIRVLVADHDELADAVALAATRDLPASDVLLQWHLVRQAVLSSQIMAAVIDEDIYVVPEHFAEVPSDELDAALDVVLAHELVHVYQHLGLGLKPVTEPASAREAYQAWTEGHAQWVARQIAASRGTTAAMRHLLAPHDDDPAADRTSNAPLRLRYEGGERFVTRCIEALGYGEAISKLKRDPPSRIEEIRDPELWLQGSLRGKIHLFPTDLIDLLLVSSEDRAGTTVFPLAAYGSDTPAQGWRSSSDVNATFDLGRMHGIDCTVRVHTFDAAKDARAFRSDYVKRLQRRSMWLRVNTTTYAVRDVRQVAESGSVSVLRLTTHADATLYAPGLLVALVQSEDQVASITVDASHTSSEAFTAYARTVATLLPDDASDMRLAWQLGALPINKPNNASLTRLTASTNAAVRLLALDVYREQPRAGQLADVIDRALQDSDPDVQAHAAALLASLPAHLATPRAYTIFQDTRHPGRRFAVRTLGRAPPTKQRRSALRRARQDTDPNVVIACIWAVREVARGARVRRSDPTRVRLRGLSRHASPRVRLALLTSRTYGARERLLNDDVPRIRAAAWGGYHLFAGATGPSEILLALNSAPRASDSDYEAALSDPLPRVRVAAAQTLSMRSEQTLANNLLVPYVRAGLSSRDSQERQTCVILAMRLTEHSDVLVASLTAALHDPDLGRHALDALALHGEDAASAVPTMIDMARRGRGRQATAKALGVIGVRSRPAIDLLQDLLQGPHPRTRLLAARSLLQLDPTHAQARRVAFHGLDETSEILRRESILSLGALTDGASLDRLEHIGSSDRSELMRLTAIDTLLDQAVASPQARRAAISGLNDESAYVWRSVVGILRHRHVDLLETEQLLGLLETGSRNGRRNATLLLAQRGARDERMAPVIATGLQAPDDDRDMGVWTHNEMLDALIDLGPLAKPAAPTARLFLASEHEEFRSAAAQVLLAIPPVSANTVRLVSDVLLRLEYDYTVAGVLDALRKANVDPSPALPGLRALLTAQRAVPEAAALITSCGVKGRAALPELQAIAEDERADEEDREEAEDAIQALNALPK